MAMIHQAIAVACCGVCGIFGYPVRPCPAMPAMPSRGLALKNGRESVIVKLTAQHRNQTVGIADFDLYVAVASCRRCTSTIGVNSVGIINTRLEISRRIQWHGTAGAGNGKSTSVARKVDGITGIGGNGGNNGIGVIEKRTIDPKDGGIGPQQIRTVVTTNGYI